MSWRLAAVVVVCATGGQSLAAAQASIPLSDDAAIARAFGSGAHAFFGGDYQRAYDDLTQAIAAGTKDPRAFYFRGLAARRMGRIDEAEADFSSAARIEADTLGDWPVSRTLERIQGDDRLAIERHRVRSRIEAIQTRKDAADRRYSQIESVQDTYLRRRRPEGVIQDNASAFGTPEPRPVEQIPPGRPVEALPEAPADAGDNDFESTPEPPMAEREPAAEAVESSPAFETVPEPAPAPGNDPLPADAPGDTIFE
jgi:tetratricopeptide (TPR) repeat protein